MHSLQVKTRHNGNGLSASWMMFSSFAENNPGTIRITFCSLLLMVCEMRMQQIDRLPRMVSALRRRKEDWPGASLWQLAFQACSKSHSMLKRGQKNTCLQRRM